jgi:hypothetical protein
MYENYYRLQFLCSIKLLDGDIALEIYIRAVLNDFLRKCSYLYSAELKRETSIILEAAFTPDQWNNDKNLLEIFIAQDILCL